MASTPKGKRRKIVTEVSYSQKAEEREAEFSEIIRKGKRNVEALLERKITIFYLMDVQRQKYFSLALQYFTYT